MYFRDLQPYDWHVDRAFPGVRAVGWLDKEHPFSTGIVSKHIVQKLKSIMARNTLFDVHVNPIRGVHPCELCSAADSFDKGLRIGSSEIWLPEDESNFLAAPSMVLHYIEAHNYLPPDAFLSAIVAFDMQKRYNAQAEYLKIYSLMTAQT